MLGESLDYVEKRLEASNKLYGGKDSFPIDGGAFYAEMYRRIRTTPNHQNSSLIGLMKT